MEMCRVQWRYGECDGDVESVMEMWGVRWRCGECDGDVFVVWTATTTSGPPWIWQRQRAGPKLAVCFLTTMRL